MQQIVSLPAECKKFCELITFTKKFSDKVNHRFKTTVHKELPKTLGTYLFCQYN